MRRLLLLLPVLALAPMLRADATNPNDAEIQQIIRNFAAKEAEFATARANYTYRQTVKIQEMDEAGNPGGKFELVSDIIFTPEGKRSERIVRAPMTTLRNIIMTPEDEQDLRDVQPFVLTSKEIDQYEVRYLGKQNADEIPCYVFAVKPKAMEKGKRYFQGQIWVDDRDLQIVKTYGRGVGLLKKGSDNQFPKFETYREQVDGKYWFPTYTIAKDTLQFQSGMNVPIRMTVKYEDYKQFKSDIKLVFGDEEKEPEAPKPGAPKPATPKP